jgi:capsid protein
MSRVSRIYDRVADIAKFVATGKVSRRLQAAFDAADVSPENRRHWANAKDEPPAVAYTREQRRRLRVNATYETDNNCYAEGTVSTAGSDLLGYCGPQLQALSDDTGLNAAVEQEWKRWGDTPEVNFPSKMKILDRARRVEGEGFQVLFTDDEVENGIGISLNFNVLSARRVTDPQYWGVGWGAAENGRLNDDGVIVDLIKGRPVAYKVMAEVDELNGTMMKDNLTTIKARYCQQWFQPKRAGQYRGVSEIAAALPLFAYLRRFTLATVSTAEIIASMTAFLKTNLPPGDGSGPMRVTEWSEFPITRGMLNTLPEGWDPVTLDPKHPSTTYQMFVDMLLREIGRVLNMPFGVVAGDFSKYNYSSGRLNFRGWDDTLKYERLQLAIRCLNPLFREWLLEFAKVDSAVARAMEQGKIRHAWAWPTRASIDPEKDAKAEDIRLKNGTTTYAEVYSDRGGNWLQSFEQRKRESEKIIEFGLDKVIDLKTASPAPPGAGAGADETETADTYTGA